MSGKPKKNKAPKAEKPIEDELPVEDIEEQPFEVKDISEAPKSADKEKAPADAKKKKKGRRFKLSSVDPIILASFSIFMIACLIVSGITIYDAVDGKSSDKVAEYGDKIDVYYTGSFFAYYDEEGAVIFDTDMEEVGDDNDKYKKSYSYTEKQSYSTMQMTVGQGSLLDAFKNALIGHKPGDVVKVEIPIEDGYGGTLTEGVDKFTVAKTGQVIYKVQLMTASNYLTFFGVDEAPESGFTSYNVDSPYGWKANVTGVSGNMVSVEYLPDDNGTYTKNEVTYKVNGAVTDVINFDYQIADFTENAKMLKGVYDNQLVYFIKSDGANMTYKTAADVDIGGQEISGELIGAKLYFVIKFVGYTES